MFCIVNSTSWAENRPRKQNNKRRLIKNLVTDCNPRELREPSRVHEVSSKAGLKWDFVSRKRSGLSTPWLVLLLMPKKWMKKLSLKLSTLEKNLNFLIKGSIFLFTYLINLFGVSSLTWVLVRLQLPVLRSRIHRRLS